jgi:exonuclease SbcC
MKILDLRLKGFIGIKKGLGVDEIKLDFEGLDGLVAFDGPNGHGKTTILDNLHPFRCLASRNKSLQHHVFLRDSEKELTFQFGNDTYRTLIKIDSESERTEGFIYKNMNTESETTGKVKEYDRYITDLFGTQSLFFNSIFCAQNSDKLSDMTTGSLKALFSEFLQLDKLVKYEETAKQCVNILTGQKEGVERKIETLQNEIEGLNFLERDKEEYKRTLGESQTQLETWKKELEANQTKLAECRESIIKEEAIVQRIEDQKNSADKIKKDISGDSLLTCQTLELKRTEIHQVRNDMQTATLLLADKDNILRAADVIVKERPVLELLSKGLKIKRTEENAVLEAVTGIRNKHAEKLGVLRNLEYDPELQSIQAQILSQQEKTADFGKKDPDCKSTTCSFIVSALAAIKTQPELKQKLSDRDLFISKQKNELSAEVNDIETELKFQNSVQEDITKECAGMENGICKIESIISDAEQKALLLSDVKVADEKLSNLKAKEAVLIAEGLKLKEELDARTEEKTKQLTNIKSTVAELEFKLDANIHVKSNMHTENIKALNFKIEERGTKITDLTILIGNAEKDEIEINTKNNQLATHETDKSKLTKELSDWQYLKNACSKDGLRALEIDSVSPIITGYANDLLNSSDLAYYTIKLKTQDEETGKEIFEIWTIWPDGSEVLLDLVSGGEKVWGHKALRQGLTLLSKEKFGKNFLTALADEEDGALNTENAIKFVEMYRPFMASGGFSTCIFITHRTECVALADHVLSFAKGGITIER